MIRNFFLLILISALSPQVIWAYPEMVRHGYVNCASCHVSPSGGGVLTQYGRELSREALSTTGKEGEGRFAYGLAPTPSWLALGGEIRAIQTYRDTPSVREGRFIVMQADLEAAATYRKLTMMGSIGRSEVRDPKSIRDQVISRKHYVNYRPTDEISFRAGRFFPNHGIQVPDHFVSTKRGLGWDQGGETYNLEGAWIGERFNFFAAAVLGRPDQPSLNKEKGSSVSASTSVADTYKLGLSHYYGINSNSSRQVFGPFGIWGFTPRFFLLSELDFQALTPRQNDASPTQWGWVNYQRLNYEIFQGFHAYLTQELSRLNFGAPNSLATAYGLGIQFFPRPHFELNLAWQKQRVLALFPEYMDFAWLLFHFYL